MNVSPLVRRAAALASLVLAACGAQQVRHDSVEMDPMELVAIDVDGQKVVEVLDPETLFREGGQAFGAGRYADAARKYLLVVQHFGESRWADVSRFNGALALERSWRCGEALEIYAELAERTAGSKDAHDALFRIATCQEQLEAWRAAVAAFDRLLAPEYGEIGVADRIEATTRRAVARQRLGELAEAERDFTEALDLYRANLHLRALHTDRYVSLAQFQVGEIYRELFTAIRFQLPVERMERDLEDKSNLFLKAQAAYLRTLRLHHPDFSVKAGYRLGALYEMMYDHMMAAEVPSELNREEVGIYYEELRSRIRPLVERAVGIYERNLRLGERVGKDDEWIRRTEAGLARLREVLRLDATRQAVEQLD